MKKKMLVLCLMPLAWTACKKDDKKEDGAAKETSLVNGKWQITEMKAKSAFTGEIDLLEDSEDCEKDNFYLFNSNKTMTVDEGASKCDASDPQTTTDGNWQLNAAGTELKISGSGLTEGYGDINFKVVQLDNNVIKVHKDTTMDFMGTPITGSIDVTMTNRK